MKKEDLFKISILFNVVLIIGLIIAVSILTSKIEKVKTNNTTTSEYERTYEDGYNEYEQFENKNKKSQMVEFNEYLLESDPEPTEFLNWIEGE